MRNKVYILGSPGSCKSKLAGKLASKLSTSNYSLDKIKYKDNLAKLRDSDEKRKILKDIAKQDSWVVEGSSNELLLMNKADLIILVRESKNKLYLNSIKGWFNGQSTKYTLNSLRNISRYEHSNDQVSLKRHKWFAERYGKEFIELNGNVEEFLEKF
jgi:adenylate kinase family enzyme